MVQQCQTAWYDGRASFGCPTELDNAQAYTTLICSAGYRGRMCSKCAAGHGYTGTC